MLQDEGINFLVLIDILIFASEDEVSELKFILDLLSKWIF